MNIKLHKIKNKLILVSIFLVSIAILDVFLHPSKNIKDFVKQNLSQRNLKSEGIEIPRIHSLKSYLNSLVHKPVFLRIEKGKNKGANLEAINLDDYFFNGIVELYGTKYVAIYKKKDESQYLVPEKQIFEGMKIEKIGENSITLKLYGGKEKEIPLYSGGPLE